MATAPNPRQMAAQRRAEAFANFRVVIVVDGAEHVFRLAEVTAIDVADLRRALGISPTDLAGELSVLPDADRAAAAVWLARRQAGERRLEYETVAEKFKVGMAVSVHHEDEPEADDGGFVDPPA